jgi:hypothetical protein
MCVNVAFKFQETRERKFGKKEIKASILIGVRDNSTGRAGTKYESMFIHGPTRLMTMLTSHVNM